MDVQHPHRQASTEAEEQKLNVQEETCFPKAQTPSSHMSVKMSLLFRNLSEKSRQWLYLRSAEKKAKSELLYQDLILINGMQHVSEIRGKEVCLCLFLEAQKYYSV